MLKFLAFSACFFIVTVFISVCHSCQKGYYNSPCKPCPVSTYKDYTGRAGSCKPCPVNSGHHLSGSTSISSCKCIKGYEGAPEHHIPCRIRRCHPLQTPRNGAVVGVCNNEYSSVCRMKCFEGYEAIGSLERQCFVRQDGVMMWTGTYLHCGVVVCPELRVNYGQFTCTGSSFVYKTRCIFQCNIGYQLKGSKERVCQSDKSWSGNPTSCRAISCPKLPPVTGATISHPECLAGPMRPFTSCGYHCYKGYFVDGESVSTVSRYLDCQINKTWSAQVPKCRDMQPPALQCPRNMITSASKGKATGKMFWSIQVSDNSVGVEPDAKIIVRSSHMPMQDLPIGNNQIYVNATDNAGNVRTCAFEIEIKDTEPPTCSFCPGDIVKEETRAMTRVNWKNPVCSDNGGKYVTYYANRSPGEAFRVPGTYHVAYTVEDEAGNVNRNCSFDIILKVKTCTLHPPPRNGALACMTVQSTLQCAVLCKTGTDFEFNPPLTYLCAGGQWEYWGYIVPYERKTPWPNCSAKAHSYFGTNNHFSQYYFYSGDANDPNVKEAIKDKFHSLLTKSYFIPPHFCAVSPKCTKDNISVSPGVIG